MNFAFRIAAWQRQHGRHGLPWQGTRDPYRVWLAEIMLQQTQVTTVVPYYQRFLQRFADIAALAAASQEEIMPYWAGLGYYARARHLHRCAQEIVNRWEGQFPRDAQQLATLPGIGRSTAAAIAAFSYGERRPILDGNVKRVFARHFGIVGECTRREIEQRLWHLAQAQIDAAPGLDMPAYTQGLMDLGATLCTRTKPDCQRCPLQNTCVAQRESRQHELPTPKARKALPERHTHMLMLVQDGAVLLQQRPNSGIWASLWSLPEFDTADDLDPASHALGLEPQARYELAAFTHTFTHYRLHIQPWYVPARPLGLTRANDVRERWVSRTELASVALPAPVKKLLKDFFVTHLPGE
jgi:A/G-specific adenine glycosylase